MINENSGTWGVKKTKVLGVGNAGPRYKISGEVAAAVVRSRLQGTGEGQGIKEKEKTRYK